MKKKGQLKGRKSRRKGKRKNTATVTGWTDNPAGRSREATPSFAGKSRHWGLGLGSQGTSRITKGVANDPHIPYILIGNHPSTVGAAIVASYSSSSITSIHNLGAWQRSSTRPTKDLSYLRLSKKSPRSVVFLSLRRIIA